MGQVSDFADALMLKYMTPAKVTSLLMPQSDPQRLRLRQLLQAVYEMRFLTVRQIDGVEVVRKDYQVSLRTAGEVRGQRQQVIPDTQRFSATLTAPDKTAWIGMELDTKVSARVAIEAGALESIASEDLSDVGSLADFQARFQFIDLPAFMRQAGVTSLQELKDVFPQQVQLIYGDPPAYDPNDPAARRTFRLTIASLFMPALTIEGAMREAKVARDAAAALRPTVGESNGAEIQGPAAWLVIFPKASLPSTGPSEANIRSVFASSGLVVAFEDPT
jgi:hypothetical protein